MPVFPAKVTVTLLNGRSYHREFASDAEAQDCRDRLYNSIQYQLDFDLEGFQPAAPVAGRRHTVWSRAVAELILTPERAEDDTALRA